MSDPDLRQQEIRAVFQRACALAAPVLGAVLSLVDPDEETNEVVIAVSIEGFAEPLQLKFSVGHDGSVLMTDPDIVAAIPKIDEPYCDKGIADAIVGPASKRAKADK